MVLPFETDFLVSIDFAKKHPYLRVNIYIFSNQCEENSNVYRTHVLCNTYENEGIHLQGGNSTDVGGIGFN